MPSDGEPWRANLRNSAGDIVVDIALLLAIIYSYVPQIIRIKHHPSSSSFFTSSLRFHALFSTAQLSNALISAGMFWPSVYEPVLEMIGDCQPSHEKIYCNDGRLYGWRAFGGILGLLQIAVQWACSIALILTFVRYSTRLPSRIIVSTLVVLHVAVFPLFAASIMLPSPGPRGIMGIDLPAAMITFANVIQTPIFLALQFLMQFVEVWTQHGESAGLSLRFLGFQVPLMVALSSRWLLRLWTFPSDLQSIHWSIWSAGWLYVWIMPLVNYSISAVGYAALLIAYYLASRKAVGVDEGSEHAPLLG